MKFTDIFINRPVLATVISLLILLFGLRAILELPIRQFPKMENTTITVTTVYPGASAELVQGFITQPIQSTIASADGIDYLTAESREGVSIVSAHIVLNYDPNLAFTEIMAKVAQVRGQLPRQTEDPIIFKETDDSNALLYASFNSEVLTRQQITDYISRVVQPKLETIPGVAEAAPLGSGNFAMRIWLDPRKMAARNITPPMVSQALMRNNFQSAAGKTKGMYVAIDITAATDLQDADEFANIVIKSEKGSVVRLRDVAIIELGGEDYNSEVTFNGRLGVFIGVKTTPSANPLSVIQQVREQFSELANDLPPSLHAEIVYDVTEYIEESIDEVIKTIVEATLIVLLVIFLFLGSLRAVSIPLVTIPLSLIGVCSLMLALGYSINLLTLLAMVLAIGLVVDDAIVVVENIHRHIEKGKTPLQASLIGAREIGLPIIGMTLTLAAVYAPIGFMGGLTGALFKEFAFTLASAVIISGIVALTLSPMMCSKILTSELSEGRFAQYLDQKFEVLKQWYQRKLHNALNYRPVTVVLLLTVLGSLFFLYSNTQQETAPEEDKGFFLVFSQAPQYATLDYLMAYTREIDGIFASYSEAESYFSLNGYGGANQAISIMSLKPWSQRKHTVQDLKEPLQTQLNAVAGLQSYAIVPPALPGGGGGAAIQFVITGTGDHELIYPVAEQLKQEAMNSGLFLFVSNSLKFDRPEISIDIQRDKALEMGITMEDIGMALASSLSGGYVNLFSIQGRSYKVIPQLARPFRMNAKQLAQIYITAPNGTSIPLSTVATITQSVAPSARSQFQQLNSATLEGVLMPGTSIGDGLRFMEQKAQELLPQGMSYDYGGQSRQFVQEGNALIVAFFMALLIIFLVLAAQYESFRDPLIILFTVPLSICGALIPLNLGLATINIYTQIGLVTLIGLISKHGILMVDYANHLQAEQNLSIREAIEQAAAIRLRPILMTTAAMIFGVLPLLFASGAGANSRFDIGLVIATGLFIGTLFTLFVVPTMYTFFAGNHRPAAPAVKETCA
ncbi:MAG: MMPL family transporter [Legionellales bacterium]|nr:MMPL family transporter [Legionellales bacterium]